MATNATQPEPAKEQLDKQVKCLSTHICDNHPSVLTRFFADLTYNQLVERPGYVLYKLIKKEEVNNSNCLWNAMTPRLRQLIAEKPARLTNLTSPLGSATT